MIFWISQRLLNKMRAGGDKEVLAKSKSLELQKLEEIVSECYYLTCCCFWNS